MSDPVIRRVRRSIDEARNRGGMQAGMPKVTIDAADAERLCIVAEELTASQRAEQQPQPESATHYRPSTGVYYEVIDGKTYAWRDPKVGWMPSPRKGIPDDCVCLSSEQQPAPDVAGLVEALETIKRIAEHPPRDKAILGVAESALAAHRKGGDTQ